MPVVLLGALKYILIAIIWLIFIFAIRAVWLETKRQVRTTVATKLVPVAEPRQGASAPAGNPPEQVASGTGSAVFFAVEGPYSGHTFRVSPPAVIGRDGSCDIGLANDNFVSTKHAQVTKERRHLIVTDLGSRNGTLVNGDPVTGEMRITKGDIIQIGKTALKVVSI